MNVASKEASWRKKIIKSEEFLLYVYEKEKCEEAAVSKE